MERIAVALLLTGVAGADHDVAVSPDGDWYVDVYSRVDVAPAMELRRADGKFLAELERGKIDALLDAGWKTPEAFVAKGRDGTTDIWGMVVCPRDFDSGGRYPVIDNICAGPHDSFVPKTFWSFGCHSGGDKAIGMQALADLGFIVVQIDDMGTANRSKAFHGVAWKNPGDSGFPDRIAWHRAQAARDPSCDIARVGIYGASRGRPKHAGRTAVPPGVPQGRRCLERLLRQPHGQDQLERAVDGVARRRELCARVRGRLRASSTVRFLRSPSPGAGATGLEHDASQTVTGGDRPGW